ncbi:biotin synthase BioB [Clostridium sp.]|uniref:biotin synthase BioB n=1 Tax=Clostridium sp. TaxID=1506 RepID=UPI00346405B1
MINSLKNKVLNGEEISFQEARGIYDSPLSEILEAANEIREKFCGKKVDLCSIVNGKSGRCSEDCKYCSQSAHYNTGVEEYDLLNEDDILNLALENQEAGVHRFSIVTSGRALKGEDFNKVVDIYNTLREKTELKLCASHGIIGIEEAKRLKEVGITTYHHNLETSREFFKETCTTHRYEERISTIKACKEAGLNICSGGIIGMGESVEDRLSMAFELKELDVMSVPVNILNPIANTPLQFVKKISKEDILRTIATFRFILPKSYIRYAGGRASLEDKVKDGFLGGVNSALVGDYLTTLGNKIDEDIELIKSLGMEV